MRDLIKSILSIVLCSRTFLKMVQTSRGDRKLVPRASPLPFPWSERGRGKGRGEALGTRLRWPIEEFWMSDIPWMVTPRKWC